MQTEQLYQMGICISYDKVMELEDRLAAAVCARFDEDGVVSPSNLRKNIFTIGALDNLDHNPSSTTSHSSFHGTAISIFQIPTKTNPGDARRPVKIAAGEQGKCSIPEDYATVPAVALKTSKIYIS